MWLWDKISLRNAVEIDVRIANLQAASIQRMTLFRTDAEPPNQPIAAPAASVAIRSQLVAPELSRAAVRHGLVRDVADRLEQAYGKAKSGLLFRNGWLYGRDGSTQASIYGPGIWRVEGDAQLASVEVPGGIRCNDGELVGVYSDGVVLDLDGNAVACLELAAGIGTPDDFKLTSVQRDPRAQVPGGGTMPDQAVAAREPIEMPRPTGNWSGATLQILLKAPS